MKTLLKLLIRLYPPAWRARYGREMEALVEDAPPRWTDAVNLAASALTMRFRCVHPAKLMLGLTVAGACAGAGIAYYQTPRYESAGEFRLAANSGTTLQLLQGALSQRSLEPVIEAFNLYPNGTAWQRVENFRRNIIIQGAVNGTFRVSFRHDDPSIAANVWARLGQAMSQAGIEPASGYSGTVPTPILNKRYAVRGMVAGMILALCAVVARRFVRAV